uniref:Uncharacterized protein n=1 Tax=Bombyx mori TaxID=7091 RepID=A0A8R2HTJ0_BOMMO|nr:uncharacterized protein LOC101739437 isoform X1 [Bombyx mori]
MKHKYSQVNQVSNKIHYNMIIQYFLVFLITEVVYTYKPQKQSLSSQTGKNSASKNIATVTPARYKKSCKRRHGSHSTFANNMPDFPEVEYPTDMSDSSRPFYFNEGSILSPFPNDVKASFQNIMSQSKPKNNAQYLSTGILNVAEILKSNKQMEKHDEKDVHLEEEHECDKITRVEKKDEFNEFPDLLKPIEQNEKKVTFKKQESTKASDDFKQEKENDEVSALLWTDMKLVQGLTNELHEADPVAEASESIEDERSSTFSWLSGKITPEICEKREELNKFYDLIKENTVIKWPVTINGITKEWLGFVIEDTKPVTNGSDVANKDTMAKDLSKNTCLEFPDEQLPDSLVCDYMDKTNLTDTIFEITEEEYNKNVTSEEIECYVLTPMVIPRRSKKTLEKSLTKPEHTNHNTSFYEWD